MACCLTAPSHDLNQCGQETFLGIAENLTKVIAYHVCKQHEKGEFSRSFKGFPVANEWPKLALPSTIFLTSDIVKHWIKQTKHKNIFIALCKLFWSSFLGKRLIFKTFSLYTSHNASITDIFEVIDVSRNSTSQLLTPEQAYLLTDITVVLYSIHFPNPVLCVINICMPLKLWKTVGQIYLMNNYR